MSTQDVEAQIIPFIRELPSIGTEAWKDVDITFFSAEGGHGIMPTKEETIRLLVSDLQGCTHSLEMTSPK